MPIELVDTHAHLDFEEYDADRAEVVRRAAAAGVKWIVNAGNRPSRTQYILDLFKDYANIRVALGAHPHYADNFDEAEFRTLAADPRIVAIGETGLDYYKSEVPREKQLAAFEAQLKIALDCGKPIIIHSREAADDTLALLKKYRPAGEWRGVQHCFSGGADFAQEILGLGLHISFTGIITFPKTGRLKEVVRLVPEDRLMLETDCPYLAPQPVRGKRNEPAFVAHIAAAAAEIRGESPEKIALSTTANAKRLFGL